MKPRRLYRWIILGSLGAILVGGWILDRSGVFVRALKPEVVKALSAATGREVTVGSIEGGLFGAIVVSDLSMGYAKNMAAFDGSLSVKRATVTFSLWDFLVLKKSAIQSLRRLDLDSPDISLRVLPLPSVGPVTISRNWTVFLAGLPLPPITTHVLDGRVNLSLHMNEVGETLFEGLNANLDVDQARGIAALALDGRSYGGQLGIRAHLQPAQALGNATFQLGDLDMAKLSQANWIPSGIPSLEEGRAEGRLELSLAGKLSAKGELHVSGVKFSVPKAGEVEDLDADLRLEGARLGLERLKFRTQGALWQGSGEVADLAHPELALYVSSIDGRPTWQDYSVDAAKIAMKASSSQVELESLTLTSGSGSAFVSGIADFLSGSAGTLAVDAHLHQFPLPQLSTYLDGQVQLDGEIPRPHLLAHLSAESLSLGAESLEHALLFVDSKGLSTSAELRADWRGFSGLSLAISGTPYQSALRLSDGTRKILQGQLKNDFKELKLKAEIPGLDAAYLCQGLGLKLGLEKNLKGSLSVSGAWKNPDLRLNIDGRELQTRFGQALPLLASLGVRDGNFYLDELKIRGDEVKASGALDVYNVHFNHADLPVLAALSPISLGEPQGSLSGDLELKRILGEWNGEFDVDASDFKELGYVAKETRLQGEAGQGYWHISKLEASQVEGGTMEGSLAFDPLRQKNADFELSSKDWLWAGRRLSAKLEANGSRPGRLGQWLNRFSGEDTQGVELGGPLQLREIQLDGNDLPDLEGNWSRYTDGGIKLSKLTWGPGCDGVLEWDSSKHWSAVLSAKGASFKTIAILSGHAKSAPAWPLDLDLTARGQGDFGDAKLSLSPGLQAELHWLPDATGKTRLSGTATVSDFSLARGLDLLGLWTGNGLRSDFQGCEGRVNAQLNLDTAVEEFLSFSASVDGLKQGGNDWGYLNLSGTAKAGLLEIHDAQLSSAPSQLELKELAFSSNPDGSASLSCSFSATAFPDFAYFRLSGDGAVKTQFNSDGGQASASWTHLKVNRQDFDAGAAQVTWDPAHVNVAQPQRPSRWGLSLAKDKAGSWNLDTAYGELPKGGQVSAKNEIDEEGQPRISVSGSGVPCSMVAAVLDWPLDLGGLAYGNAVFRIPDDPNAYMYMLLSAKVENGSLEGFPMDLVTGSVALKDGVLDLEPLGEPVRAYRKDAYEAQVWGKIPIYRNDDKPLDPMDFEGKLISGNLNALNYLDEIDSASGTVTAEAQIRGTALSPLYNGKLEVQGGQIHFKRLLAPATDLNAQLFLENNSLQIVKCDAQMGSSGQRIYVSQADPKLGAVTFDKWLLSTLNLGINATKQGIQLQATPNYLFLNGTLYPKLTLSGSMDSPRFGGEASLAKADVYYPIQDSSPPRPVSPDDFSERLFWNAKLTNSGVVTLHSLADAGDLGFSQNAVIKSLTRVEAFRADVESPDQGLLLQGAGDDFGLQGRIKVTRGLIKIFNIEFPINTDKTNYFDLQRHTDSEISLWSSRSVVDQDGRDGVVDVHFMGSPGHIKVKMSSTDNAALSTSGNPDDDQQEMARLIGLNSDDAAGALSSIFVKQVLSTLGSAILKRPVPFDIDVKVPGAFGANSTSATVDADSNTLEGQDIVNVTVGGHIPQTNAYLDVGYDRRNGRSPLEPGDADAEDYHADVDVPISQRTKLEVTVKQDSEEGTDYRAGLSQSQDFDNYNPRRRREEIEAARQSPSPTPSPQTSPTPVPTNSGPDSKNP